MERLTKKFIDGNAYCEEIEDVGIKGINYPTYVGKAVDKLAEYEELEEQGLLLRLPCKVGDTVYYIWNVDDKPEITEMNIARLSNLVALIENGEFGKTVFLTKEEAEQKLKEMENK